MKFNLEGKSLREIDGEGLAKTKKQHDYPFFFKLMTSASTLKGMKDGLRRAQSQQMDIQMGDLTAQIRKMVVKEFEEVQKEEISQCEKLKKLIKVNQRLSYLKQLEETAHLREQQLGSTFAECRKTEDEFTPMKEAFK